MSTLTCRHEPTDNSYRILQDTGSRDSELAGPEWERLSATRAPARTPKQKTRIIKLLPTDKISACRLSLSCNSSAVTEEISLKATFVRDFQYLHRPAQSTGSMHGASKRTPKAAAAAVEADRL
jgi:hypothetical protein